MSDPLNVYAVDDIRIAPVMVLCLILLGKEILRAIEYYGQQSTEEAVET